MKTVVSRIEEFNKDLLPGMVKLKYKAMGQNAFRFFRGTCHLFYEDLSKINLPETPLTWICGDLHLENFGSFKGNNRMEYFDLNDFDESALAPLSWELARILTSIYVAFDSLQLKQQEATEMCRVFMNSYIETLRGGKAYYIDPRTAKGIVHAFLKNITKRNESNLLDKLTTRKHDGLVLKIDNETHFEIEKKLKKDLIKHLNNWIRDNDEWPNNYKVTDAVFRVAGTGSIGLKRYMFLLQSTKSKKKFLLVELKQVVNSSLAPYNKTSQPIWLSQAERLIHTKQRMQNISPALLSTIDFEGCTFVLQEMQPTADKINFSLIENSKKELKRVLNSMAILTGSAQIRSGGTQGSAIIDELTAFSNKTNWQEYLLTYARSYSTIVKKDFNEFQKGINHE